MIQASAKPKTAMQSFLDVVERVGNIVPHPVVIFLILIGIVIVLSAILGAFGTSVTFETHQPGDQQGRDLDHRAAKPARSADGIRFMYASLIPNFMSFTAVGLMIAAMIGAGVAEESGLVTALIRKLVAGLAALGADLHPGLRRHPGEHRGRCRLSRPDPARRRRLPQRRTPSAGRPGAGLCRPWPALSPSTC